MIRSRRDLSLLLACVAAGGSCIKPVAPPPAAVSTPTPPGAPPAAAASPGDKQPNPFQEAANARIAGVPRIDLLGGAGIAAFKISGDNARAGTATPITVTGQPFTDAMRFTVKDASSHEWAVQLQTPATAPVA